MFFVTPELRAQRLWHCQHCPQAFFGLTRRDDINKFLGLPLQSECYRRCRLCGCFVYAKSKLAWFHCPMRLW